MNNASAWVNNLCGVRVNAPSNASVSIPADTSVSLNITKTANTTGPVLPGQVIEYTIKVCNTGNLTLNNVNVTDNRTGSYTIARSRRVHATRPKRPVHGFQPGHL